MQIVWTPGRLGKLLIKPLHKAWNERVRSLNVRNVSQSQLFDQTVLKRSVRTFHTPFGLRRIGADDLYVQLIQSPAKLGHTVARLRALFGYAEHGMFVGIKGNRTAVFRQIALQSFKIGERCLGFNKAKIHQRTRRIIYENQKCAAGATIFKPMVIRSIYLDQLTNAFSAQSWLMELLALLFGKPKTIVDHPVAKRLTRNLKPVMRLKSLGRQSWAEVRIILTHQIKTVNAPGIMNAIVGSSTAQTMPDPGRAAFPKAPQKSKHLAAGHVQQICGRRNRSADHRQLAPKPRYD